MRRALLTLALVAMAGWVLHASRSAWAYPQAAVSTGAACASCHTVAAGGPDLTDTGKKYLADASTKVPTDVAGAEYSGTKKCSMCHRPYFTSWSETAHAKALANLEAASDEATAAFAEKAGIKLEGKATESADCLKCHVTGLGLAGGWKAGAEGADLLAGVTCEACHGPGSVHIKAAKADKAATMSAVSEKMCRQCHTEKTSPEFDFEKYKAKGVHTVEKSE